MWLEDMSRNKTFFPGLNITRFTFYYIYPFVTYLLTLPHTYPVFYSDIIKSEGYALQWDSNLCPVMLSQFTEQERW
jgi:hypothetical protein